MAHVDGFVSDPQKEQRSWLVTTQWLAQQLGASGLLVLDGSWHLPAEKRHARQEFLAAHIPGALFFDIDDISDQSSNLPHMLPRPGQFSAQMRKLGVSNSMDIVIYDTPGLFSAARVWWTFRAMGHDRVSVLDGGLKKWLHEGRLVESGEAKPRPASHFTASLQPERVRCAADILAKLPQPGEAARQNNVQPQHTSPQLIDARPPGRFRGEGTEPRPGMRSGHIPGAFNVYYADLVHEDGTVKSAADIEAVFKAQGIDLDKPMVTSCGSGVTGALLAFALALTGRDEAALYDGSWAEWGGRDDLPIELGDHAEVP